MRRLTMVAVVAGTAGLAGVAAARFLSGPRNEDARLVVTVNRPMSEVAPGGRLPEPLKKIAEDAEIELRQAPGHRGTEIEARLREAVPARAVVARLAGEDPRQPIRLALREAKSILETGEMVRPDEPSTSRPTPMGKVLDVVTRRARGEGRL
jgi:hypothetical protein